MGDCTLAAPKGNVAFGSGKDCWAFTLTRFAKMYGKKFKVDEAKMMERLWGDNYFDAKAKKWKNYNTADSGETL
jgi:elongation factor 2